MQSSKGFRVTVWAVFVWLLTSVVGLQASAAADSMSKEEFDKRVHDYLLANPEVIMQAVQSIEARQREAEEKAAKAVLAAKNDEVFRDPASPVGGNAKGNVTLVEFFDYNCPYCRQMVPVMVQAEAGDPQLRIVYKEFPILGPDSIFAAKAALAADRQGKYLAFHKALFQVKGKVTEAVVLKVAVEAGLDVALLKTDMQSAEVQASIDRNLQLAQALRITGTPGFVAGEKIFPGATDLATITQMIQQARTGK